MMLLRRVGVILSLFAFATVPVRAVNLFPTRGPTVPGQVAQLRHGVACAPDRAPLAVKRAIWAANELRRSPYRYGGGHRSFLDSGYDCSGTVSFALAGAGLLQTPLSSSDLLCYGERGCGKWITVYARNGHAYAVIAGLRLDTTAWNSRNDRDAPRWHLNDRPPRGFESRHPAGL